MIERIGMKDINFIQLLQNHHKLQAVVRHFKLSGMKERMAFSD